jgi:hypothetical protein
MVQFDNSYIVMFKDDVSPALRDNHLNFLFSASREDPLWGDESGLTMYMTAGEWLCWEVHGTRG